MPPHGGVGRRPWGAPVNRSLEAPPDLASSLDALRARGAPRVDPVRWRFIEALARRAAAHQGATRQRLDARLQHLLDACQARLATAPPQSDRVPPPSPAPETLAELLAYIQQQTGTAAQPSPAHAELKSVRLHRSTWTRLSVDQRLNQALAQVPDNAGPLNTQRLLNQALGSMRDTSPQYLQRFMAYAEALLWIDQASLPGKASSAGGVRALRKPAGKPPR